MRRYENGRWEYREMTESEFNRNTKATMLGNPRRVT